MGQAMAVVDSQSMKPFEGMEFSWQRTVKHAFQSGRLFPSIDAGPHHSSISLRNVTVQSDVGSGSRRTSLSTSFLNPAINAAATQHNVQMCTKLDVLGGQQGSLEISEG